jgi:AraC-like DNA-binding protein
MGVTSVGRAEGFPGQRLVVLPPAVVRMALDKQLPIPLIPSDIGYYPNASMHHFERRRGCDQLILILCVRGAGWVGTEGAKFDVGPGQMVVLLPNEPHRYGAAELHPWTIYWCHAAGASAHRFARILRQDTTSPVLDVGDDLRLIGLFEEMTQELLAGYTMSHLIRASTALAHLLGLTKALSLHHWALSDTIKRVQRAIGYMVQRRQERINIPELARMANLSTSHFCAVFRKVTGFPPMDYFIRLKIRRACELLDGSDLSVKQIAEELGFSDALYLSRVFHKIQGVSPTQYRKIAKG